METTQPQDEVFDLEAAVKTLCGEFGDIDRVYLFGSRRYGTRSTRSDIDILLDCSAPIKKSKLRDFTIKYRTALDLFVMENGKAESVANESFISAANNIALIRDLNAVEIYSRGFGSTEFLTKNKTVLIDRRVTFNLTTLPSATSEYYEVGALQKFFARAREHGLPAKPYLGISTAEASDFIQTVIRSIPSASRSVTNHGSASTGWTVKLASEYDFQNLFWITVKPWLPGLAREEVAIVYDGKTKSADFNLFGNQLIVELKHIKDAGDARETVKTLTGLSDFYTRHPNIRVLLFAILVDQEVVLDDAKWEADYSFGSAEPTVRTMIVRNNN
ncbi:MAG: nucleotidyltransferase domain-containing protein [Burkholderiales bacterium]|nr:nucleotidyltransferase domain-containing protein [Burkholderiales bacterium]